MEIAWSARKHGVADHDILHALNVPLRLVQQGDDRVLLIGADTTGRLLEIVVLDPDSDDAVVIHAMALRPKLYDYL